MNLRDLDPKTLMQSPEVNALIATEWMGWTIAGHINDEWTWEDKDERCVWRGAFTPFTDPAAASEARRKAEDWALRLIHRGDDRRRIVCTIRPRNVGYYINGGADFSAIDSDGGEAERLATVRAIVAAMQASEAEGGDS